MLVTVNRAPFDASATLTIAVPEDQADAVINALRKDGWQMLTTAYWPTTPVVDSLQAALLDVSALPPAAPVRIAVELAATAAILAAPLPR
jgi:hypothetical protein